jgi:glycerol-3-phosphate acyltransferase PlsY
MDGMRRSRAAAVTLGALVGYLVGSVPFSRIVGERAAPGEDLSVSVMQVPGRDATVELHGYTPTSVKEHAGLRAMWVAMGLEAAKAAVPTLLMRTLLPGTPAAAAAAAGAVVGHAAPVWNGFRGGYGATPMIGGLLVLDPVGLAVTTGVVSGGIGLTGKQQLMMAWPLSVPIWAAVRRRPDLLGYGLVANVTLWSRLGPQLRTNLRAWADPRAADGSGGGEVAALQGEHAQPGAEHPDAHDDGG